MQSIDAHKIPAIFHRMTTSYKAYWLLAILEMCVEEKELEIPVRELCIKMLVNAWYPVHFFRLNYGAYDQVSLSNQAIRKKLDLKADISKSELTDLLTINQDREIERLIMHFKRHVLYRFLSPWITYKSDAQVENDSQRLNDIVPYSINREKGTILVPTHWANYFTQNYAVLKDFCYYQLTLYLQARNPGVPSILSKLFKPAQRESLANQRRYWEIVFNKYPTIQCIYTHKTLSPTEYDLEHYVPWSFVAHNLIWNLIPADGSINSAKGNKLPPENYLKAFVETQKLGLQTVYTINPNHKQFQDFNSFGITISEMLTLENDKLYELFENQIQPQIQIARQLGFEEWVEGTF